MPSTFRWTDELLLTGISSQDSVVRKSPLTPLMAGLQMMSRGFEGHPGEFSSSAAQTGPAERASVLLQAGQFRRRGLVVVQTVDHLTVLLPQACFAEMLHDSQHHCSLSPEGTNNSKASGPP